MQRSLPSVTAILWFLAVIAVFIWPNPRGEESELGRWSRPCLLASKLAWFAAVIVFLLDQPGGLPLILLGFSLRPEAVVRRSVKKLLARTAWSVLAFVAILFAAGLTDATFPRILPRQTVLLAVALTAWTGLFLLDIPYFRALPPFRSRDSKGSDAPSNPIAGK